MPKPTFAERMAELGLNFPPDEIPAFEAFVGDVEQSAAAIRAIDRSYAEEPSSVFTAAPTTLPPR